MFVEWSLFVVRDSVLIVRCFLRVARCLLLCCSVVDV